MKNVLLLLACLSLLGLGTAQADEIEDLCAVDVGIEGSAYQRCVNDQNEARDKLTNFTGEIRRYCEGLWDPNAVETLNCVEEQTPAKEFVDSLKGGDKVAQCRNQGGEDYVVIAYCIDENWEEVADTLISKAPADDELVSSPLAGAGVSVWRYVSDLKGPYNVKSVDSSAQLLLISGKESRVTKLAAIEVTPKGVAFLKKRIVGTRVWIEASSQGVFVYTESGQGEWGDRNIHFDQLNLTFVRNGLALPSQPANDSRYSHFFDGAVAQAESNNLGVWAGR